MNRQLAAIDLAIALVLGTLAVMFFVSGRLTAAAAVETYGHNVDSGAFQMLGGLLLAPGAILLFLAAVALWRGWRGAAVAHWVGVVFAGAPVALIGCIVLFGSL